MYNMGSTMFSKRTGLGQNRRSGFMIFPQNLLFFDKLSSQKWRLRIEHPSLIDSTCLRQQAGLAKDLRKFRVIYL